MNEVEDQKLVTNKEESQLDQVMRIIDGLGELIDKSEDPRTVVEIYVLNSIVQNIIDDEDFNPEIVDGKTVDPYLMRFFAFQRRYFQKIHSSWDDEAMSEKESDILEREVAKKALLHRLLGENQYLAHASYYSDFEKKLEGGGLMSPIGRANAGEVKKGDRVGRWNEGADKTEKFVGLPDTDWVFFAPFESEGAGNYAMDVGGYIEPTNMFVVYRPWSIIERAKLIKFNNSDSHMASRGEVHKKAEIAFSNATYEVNDGDLSTVFNRDDDLKIPWQEGYHVFLTANREEVEALFKKYGASEEWMESHIKIINSTSEGMDDKFKPEMKAGVLAWLEENREDDEQPKKLKVKGVDNSEYYSARYE